MNHPHSSYDYINIAIIDPYQLFREGVNQVLENDETLKRAMSSAHHSGLEYTVESKNIDVLLSDLTLFLREKSAIQLLRDNFHFKVSVLTSDEKSIRIKEVTESRVEGYLMK